MFSFHEGYLLREEPGSQIPKASSSPRGPCQRFETASLVTVDTSGTIGSAGLYGPCSRSAYTATCTCYRTSCSRSHLKLVAFRVIWYTGWSNTPRGGIAIMDVKRPRSHCASPGGGTGRWNNSEGISLHALLS